MMMRLRYTETPEGITFAVRVVPRASQNSIEGLYDDALRVRLAAPPVDGAANAELIKTLAKAFDVPQHQIEIISGQTSKQKRVRVTGIHQVSLEARLQCLLNSK